MLMILSHQASRRNFAIIPEGTRSPIPRGTTAMPLLNGLLAATS